MGLIGLILALVVVGVLLWLPNNHMAVDSKIKTILGSLQNDRPMR